MGTSRLLWVFISAPVGVLERLKVVRRRCIAPGDAMDAPDDATSAPDDAAAADQSADAVSASEEGEDE